MPPHPARKTDAIPFLRILVPFSGGIAAVAHLGIPTIPLLGCLVALSAIIATIGSSGRLRTGDAVLVRSVSVHLVLCAAGVLSMGLIESGLRSAVDSAANPKEDAVWMAVLLEPPEKGAGSHKAPSELWKGDGKGGFEYTGRCMAYLREGTFEASPGIGSRILTNQPPEPILFKGNPGGFDAASHHRRQGIPLTLFLDGRNSLVLPVTHGHRMMTWVYGMRDRLLGILQRYIRNPQALGIAEALLIGYRGHLDRSVADAYAGTGVIHVIAISGLHIGMLYSISMGIAGLLLGRTAVGRYLPLAVVPLLWVFALMTGCSASVMRSVCMFSLMGLGRSLLGRRGRPLNTLCATAFLLLAFRPHWIADIGFQLSFTAVSGIMLLYPSIRGAARFENRAAGYLWDMVALTLAAQLLTTPLILYHFGRFPLLFLFTNLVAVPLSSLILLAELLLCAASPFPSAAERIGDVVQSSILWMNRYVADMDGIPHATLEEVHITGLSAACLYALIAAVCMVLVHRSPARLSAALASVILFTASISWDSASRRRQSVLVVPHFKGRSMVLVVQGVRGTWLVNGVTDDADADPARQMVAIERHYRIRDTSMTLQPAASVKSMEWKGKRILALGRDAPRTPDASYGRPDLILLSENADVDPAAWYRITGCSTWVADGSNSLWKIQKWKSLSAGLPLHFHPTSRKGAFILQD